MFQLYDCHERKGLGWRHLGSAISLSDNCPGCLKTIKQKLRLMEDCPINFWTADRLIAFKRFVTVGTIFAPRPLILLRVQLSEFIRLFLRLAETAAF